MSVLTVYHGTTAASADELLLAGWHPDRGRSGGNCGNRRLLYVTSDPENALWFAEEKGESSVLEILVPFDLLTVDPEDGMADTVEDEIAAAARCGMPFSLAVRGELPAEAFSRLLGLRQGV